MKPKKIEMDRLEILSALRETANLESTESPTLQKLYERLRRFGKQFIEAQLLHLVIAGYVSLGRIAGIQANQKTAHFKLTKKGTDLHSAMDSDSDFSAFQADFSTEAIQSYKRKVEEAKKTIEVLPTRSNDEEVERLLKTFRQHEKDWYETPGYADLWKRVMAEAWAKYGHLNTDPKAR